MDVFYQIDIKRIVKLGLWPVVCIMVIFGGLKILMAPKPQVLSVESKKVYWFLLHRKSNREYLYSGIPGEIGKSELVKQFIVKSGIPGERPTPLPQLLGKQYWMVTAKRETQNPQTGPYFFTLDIPWSETEPFGPTPYLECDGQCNWQTPGEFGLHGVGGEMERLSSQDQGSSGCIRHADEDITYLYNLLDVSGDPIRYYIQDI